VHATAHYNGNLTAASASQLRTSSASRKGLKWPLDAPDDAGEEDDDDHAEDKH
jgi:hypothetical protein